MNDDYLTLLVTYREDYTPGSFVLEDLSDSTPHGILRRQWRARAEVRGQVAEGTGEIPREAIMNLTDAIEALPLEQIDV